VIVLVLDSQENCFGQRVLNLFLIGRLFLRVSFPVGWKFLPGLWEFLPGLERETVSPCWEQPLEGLAGSTLVVQQMDQKDQTAEGVVPRVSQCLLRFAQIRISPCNGLRMKGERKYLANSRS